MIFIYSFASSGSSLLQRTLVNAIKFNSVFEPFAYMPEKLTDTVNFNFVSKWFKGAPNVNVIDQYKIKDYYIASIPESEYTCEEVAPYKRELKKYLQNIFQAYGEKTVVKLVRQQSNVIFIHQILVELGIEPKYIFLKRNPVEIAYSFYRLGCYHSFMEWNYKNLCEYRKLIYKNNCYFSRTKTPIDYLIASILSDYLSFDESYEWLSKNGYRGLLIHYEDFVANPKQILKKIANDLMINADMANVDSIITKKVDLIKVNSSHYDYFFCKKLISSEDRLNLELNIPNVKKYFSYKSIRNVLFNNLFFHYHIRLFEAIMRRIYWKNKWTIIKPFINAHDDGKISNY